VRRRGNGNFAEEGGFLVDHLGSSERESAICLPRGAKSLLLLEMESKECGAEGPSPSLTISLPYEVVGVSAKKIDEGAS